MENKTVQVDKKKPKKTFKIYAIIFFLLVLSILGGFLIHRYSKVKSFDNLIYPGVSIEGIDLSGKTKEQSKKLIEEKYWNKILNKKINVKVNDKTYTLKYSKLNSTSNLDKMITDAFSYGKNLNLFEKYNIINDKKGKKFDLKFEYDKKAIDSFVSNIDKDVKVNPVNASLSLNNGSFTITPGTNGKRLNKDKLQKDIISTITAENFNDVTKIAVINIINPEITEDKLSLVNTKIGTYSTDYSGSQSGRKTNVELATKAVNGTLLMPGDVFSFNDTVGDTTGDKGYKEAPVIINNKLVPGFGGGVCQVSTTLFNAVDTTNLKSTERHNHSLEVHYVPKGRDATIAFGSLDYKFKNTLSSPVYIEAITKNGQVTFNIYSSGK